MRTRETHPAMTVGQLRSFVNGGTHPTPDGAKLIVRLLGRRYEVAKLYRDTTNGDDVLIEIRENELPRFL